MCSNRLHSSHGPLHIAEQSEDRAAGFPSARTQEPKVIVFWPDTISAVLCSEGKVWTRHG